MYGIVCLSLISVSVSAREDSAASGWLELSFEESVERMQKENRSLQIAVNDIEWAKNEHQKLNSFWFPSLTAIGGSFCLSNPVELAWNTLRLPFISQHIASVDFTFSWPLFAGGKRMCANKIGQSMVHLAEIKHNQEEAEQQTLLVEGYFALRLGTEIVAVRQEAYEALRQHYAHALKLEQNGLITHADCLFVEVSMDEAKRELEAAREDKDVAQQVLKSLLHIESDIEIGTTTPLFVNDSVPSVDYFKKQIPMGNYLVNQLKLQQNITKNQLKIARSAYFPTIAVVGKQTLCAHGVDKYLMPRTMIGVGFSWNLFDGLNRERTIRQARISDRQLVLGREKAITDLEVGIDKCYSQLQKSFDAIKTLTTTLRMSKELVRVRQRSFQEGMATSTDVVDAEVMLAKIQIEFQMAYYQYDVALMRLLSICGMPEMFHWYCQQGCAVIH